MATDTTEKPTTEEIYTAAVASSNLRVEAEQHGDGDVIISAGMSKSRLGAAMLRLHSEWDSVEKPAKPTKEAVERLAHTLPRLNKKPGGQLNLAKAQETANEWYAAELMKLIGKLKTLPEVRRELALRAARWRMTNCQEKAGAVIKYWLDQTCHACDGRKWKLIPGSPSLSKKMCHVCHGTGFGSVPYGQDGRRLANHMDECVGMAQQSIRKRLHHFHGV